MINSYWIITNQNGEKQYFGFNGDTGITDNHTASNDGRLSIISTNFASQWKLSRVEDLNGNYYSIYYDEDTSNTMLYPKKVIYTKNESSAINNYRAVEILYNENNSYPYSHLVVNHEGKVETHRIANLISNIKVYVDTDIDGDSGKIYRQYEFIYDVSPNSSEKRLKEIKRLGNDLDNDSTGDLPADSSESVYTFDWEANTGSALFHQQTMSTGSTSHFSFNYETGDFNGDGLTDIIHFSKAVSNSYIEITLYEKTKIGSFIIKPQITNDFPLSIGPNDFIIGDVNGDGLDDLIKISPHSPRTIYVKLSKGDGTFASPVGSVPSVIPASDESYRRIYYKSGDFNGDGKMDLVLNTGSGIIYMIFFDNNGTVSSVFQDSSNIPNTSFHSDKWVVADFNGDGFDDLYYNDINNYEFEVYLYDSDANNLPGFEAPKITESIHYPILLSDNVNLYTGDFNGDSFIDIAYLSDQFIYTFLGNGIGGLTGESISPIYNLPIGYLEYLNGSSQNFTDGFWKTGDFDSDGNDDFVFIDNTNIRLYKSKANGYFDIANPVNISHYLSGTALFSNWMTSDFNGKGTQDLVAIHGEQEINLYSNFKIYDLLSSVNNPVTGSSVTLDYGLSTYTDGVIVSGANSYPIVSNKILKHIATSMTVNDGISPVSTTSYEYYNGLTHSGFKYKQADYGFERFTKTLPDGSKEVYYYDQTEEMQNLLIGVKKINADGDLFEYSGSRYEKKQIYAENSALEKPAVNYIYKTDSFIARYDDVTPEINLSYLTNTNAYVDWKELTETVEKPQGDTYWKVTSREITDYKDVSVNSFSQGTFTDNDLLDQSHTLYTFKMNESTYVHKPTTILTKGFYFDVNNYVLETTLNEVNLFYDGNYSNTSDSDIDKGLMTEKKITNIHYPDGAVQSVPEVAEQWSYDAFGNLAGYWNPEANKSGVAFESYIYDSDYHTLPIQKSMIRPDSTASELVEEITYNDFLFPVSKTDTRNNILTTTVYDSLGRIESIKKPLDGVNPSVSFSYTDAVLNGSVITTPETVIETMADTASVDGTYKVHKYYDGFGRLVQEKKEGNNNQWIISDYFYDNMGRQYKVSVPYFSSNGQYDYNIIENPSNRYKTTEFDKAGRINKVINSDNTVKEFVYTKDTTYSIDENEHLTSVKIRGYLQTNKIYEGEHSSTEDHSLLSAYNETEIRSTPFYVEITDAVGFPGLENTILTELNGLGNKVLFDDPDMGIWTYEYNSDGNLTSQQNAAGNVIFFEYDSLGRETRKFYIDNSTEIELTSYNFDEPDHGFSIGMLTSINYPEGSDEFHYDERGRIKQHDKTISGRTQAASTLFEYDLMDRLIKETYPLVNGQITAEEVFYNYGENTALKNVIGDSSYISDYTYSALGKVTEMIYGNGISTVYDYYDESDESDNSTGNYFSYRLKAITTNTNGLDDYIMDLEYEYDRKDNVIVKHDIGRYYDLYGYDEFDRLISANSFQNGAAAPMAMSAMGSSSGGQPTPPGFPEGVPVMVIGGPGDGWYDDKVYEYDEINNINEKDGNTYSYDDSNHTHAVTSNSIYNYSYDANGNMTEKRSIANPTTDIRTFTYDILNRLTSISDDKDGAVSTTYYYYDMDGKRVKQYTSGGSTVYYYTGSYEVEVFPDTTETTTKYYYANGARIAMRKFVEVDEVITSELSYFHTDHLGTSMRLTSETGELIRVMGYKPYGGDVRTEWIYIPEDILITEDITESGEYMAANSISITASDPEIPITIGPGVDVSLLAATSITFSAGFTVMQGATFSAGTDLDLLPIPNDVETRYGYTGQEKDVSGLHYYVARYYDSDLGRFTQPDTLLDGLNRYAYVRNNPVKYVDPTGHMGEAAALAAAEAGRDIEDSDSKFGHTKPSRKERQEKGEFNLDFELEAYVSDGNIELMNNDIILAQQTIINNYQDIENLEEYLSQLKNQLGYEYIEAVKQLTLLNLGRILMDPMMAGEATAELNWSKEIISDARYYKGEVVGEIALRRDEIKVLRDLIFDNKKRLANLDSSFWRSYVLVY